jgi:lipoate-protein ligase A
MALDWALVRGAQADLASLRLYGWDPPCLSFGRNEPVVSRYDASRIEALGIDVVRRPTGGRAVWHDAELTYAVAGPSEMFGSLRKTYIAIHLVLADGLGRLGVPVELARRPDGATAGLEAGACFASPVGGELVVGGRKLVGSAQVRAGDAFLQHGSILLENRQDMVARVTRGHTAVPVATSLSDVLGRTVTFEEVAQAVAESARIGWGGTWTASSPESDPEDIAQFRDPAWTWRR